MRRGFNRRATDERGFTLVELLAVILIIGVLAAIAVAAFLSQSTKARDAAGKAQARAAQTAAEVIGTQNDGSYSGLSVPSVRALEPSLNDTGSATLVSADPDLAARGYTIVSRAANGNTYAITRSDDGTVARTCVAIASPQTAGCASGHW